MWPYFLFASVFALPASLGAGRRNASLALGIAFLAIVIFVGLRHHVGMDWNNYLSMISSASQLDSIFEYRDVAEPIFTGILIIGVKSGYGIYVANFITTIIFTIGLLIFIRTLPEPWLGVLVAVPFLIVVIAMSANRQAAAIGIILWVVSDWDRSSSLKKIVLITLAGGFHYSALVMFIFVGLTIKAPLWAKVFISMTYLGAAYYTLDLNGQVDYYSQTYVSAQEEQTQSSGAIMHTSLNAIPALLYFLLPKRRDALFPSVILRQMAFAAIAMLPLSLVASTAAGRLSLYLYPVSIQVFATLPGTFSASARALVRLAIVSLMMAILAIWLLFANNSQAHNPYRNYLFTPTADLEFGTDR